MKFRIRNVLTEFEAHIHPVQPNASTHGKSEWKHYADDTYRIKVSIREIPLPDNTKVELIIDGILIAQLPVHNRKVKLDIENSTSQGIPLVKAGQRIQIKSGQIVFAEGQYRAQ
jgi:hypothetical protein